MPVHHFSIILADVSDLTEEQVKALAEAGALTKQVTAHVSGGTVTLEYDTETQLSKAWAIYTALCEIDNAGLKAKRVEVA